MIKNNFKGVFTVYRINSYKFGQIEINNQSYQNDVIIYPDQLKDNWWRNEGHRLHKSDIDKLSDYQPDLVIIGTGASGRMKVDHKLKQYFDEHNIKYYISTTNDAVKKHNEMIDKKQQVLTALHLTC